jgi:hypothetical protein
MPDIQEDVMRELMRDATSDLVASPAVTAGVIRRQRRRQFRTRMIGAGATAAVAGLAVGIVAATSGPGPAGNGGRPTGVQNAELTAAQETLYSLSSAAAQSPRPSGRYVVMTEKTVSGGDTGVKTTVIDTVTGGGLEYQDINPGPSTAKTPQPPPVLKAAPGTSPTAAQLGAMPTSAAQLKAGLLAQAQHEQAQAEQQILQKVQAEQKMNPGQKIATPAISQSTPDDLIFSAATSLLWQPNLSPALRSALYKVLASTPGVKVNPHARDSIGRPATEISRVLDWGGADVMAFEDPANGATLETASKLPGEGLDEDTYLSVRYSNSIPPNPYRH